MDKIEILKNTYASYRENNKEGWDCFFDNALENFINFSGIDVTNEELIKLYNNYNFVNEKVGKCNCGSYNAVITEIDNDTWGDGTAYSGIAYCKDCDTEFTFLNSKEYI